MGPAASPVPRMGTVTKAAPRVEAGLLDPPLGSFHSLSRDKHRVLSIRSKASCIQKEASASLFRLTLCRLLLANQDLSKSWDSRRRAMASRGGSFTPFPVRGRLGEEGGRRRKRGDSGSAGPGRAAISGKKMKRRLLSAEPDCKAHLGSKQGPF